jgi:hypothetical protein
MEDQADYITEALDLLHGEPSLVIEPERTIIERRGGELKETVVPAFVKISTSFKGELVGMSDAALKVWIFIALSVNRKTGTAHPGLRTIAAALGKGVNTIQDCIKELETAKLLQVDRQSKKYNIYEPLGYVSANRLDPVSEPDTVQESVSEKPESVSEKPESVSDSQILNQRNQKKPDLVDGLLHFGQVAKERKEDKVEEVIQTLERGLHVNITRSLSNQTVARRILKDGRPVETWLSWVKSDEWRAARLYIYADLEKVWRDYPQAFESVEKKEYTRLL